MGIIDYKLPETPNNVCLADKLNSIKMSIPKRIEGLFKKGYDKGRIDAIEVIEEILHKIYDDSGIEHIPVKDVYGGNDIVIKFKAYAIPDASHRGDVIASDYPISEEVWDELHK